jgi:hypothetical protein
MRTTFTSLQNFSTELWFRSRLFDERHSIPRRPSPHLTTTNRYVIVESVYLHSAISLLSDTFPYRGSLQAPFTAATISDSSVSNKPGAWPL